MSVMNQGRNEIRLNNSRGQCLLENWVEERAVEPIDKPTEVSNTQLLREGHKGMLTTDFEAGVSNLTTHRVSYKIPDKPNVRQVGSKRELLEKMLFEKVSKEVHEEFNPPPEKPDFKSVTMKDYNKEDFVSVKPKPSATHDYSSEQPVTFWTEHKDCSTGISQVTTGDTPFRKNCAFSKPIDEYWDEPQPNDLQNFPKM